MSKHRDDPIVAWAEEMAALEGDGGPVPDDWHELNGLILSTEPVSELGASIKMECALEALPHLHLVHPEAALAFQQVARYLRSGPASAAQETQRPTRQTPPRRSKPTLRMLRWCHGLPPSAMLKIVLLTACISLT